MANNPDDRDRGNSRSGGPGGNSRLSDSNWPDRAGEGRPMRDSSKQTGESNYRRRIGVPPFEAKSAQIIRAKRGWGSVARKGAVKAVDFREGPASEDRATAQPLGDLHPFVAEGFMLVDEDVEASTVRERQPRRDRLRSVSISELLEKEISRPITSVTKRKIERLFGSAVDAYEHDRYPEAKRLLEQVLSVLPDSISAVELFGLTHYRMGNWGIAIKVLQEYGERSGSFDQFPVLADCFRAQRRYQDVDRVWGELSAASPSSEVMGEGRIVVAGAAADQGNLPKAISILERSLLINRKPNIVDLRQWYVLADLYERASEIGRARSLFSRIIKHDPSFFDAAERLADLG